jgi:hypothetical protein
MVNASFRVRLAREHARSCEHVTPFIAAMVATLSDPDVRRASLPNSVRCTL